MARKHRHHSILLPSRHLLGRAGQVVLLILLCSLIIMGRNGNPYAERLGHQLMEVVSPVLQVAAAPFDAVDSAGKYIASWISVHEKNARLQAENRTLLKWQHMATTIQAENYELRELLNVVPENKLSFVTASIVSDHGSGLSHGALINAGSEQGIANDQAVTSAHGLIGRIIDTSRHHARVMLLSDINSRIPVMNERTREKVILVGKGSNLPILAYVGSNSHIVAGDRMITSGDGGVFPKGVQVGEVHAVNKNGVTVNLFANMADVEYVNVIRNAQ